MVKIHFLLNDESKIKEISEYLNFNYSISYFNYENNIITILFDEPKSFSQLLNEVIDVFPYLKVGNLGRQYFGC